LTKRTYTPKKRNKKRQYKEHGHQKAIFQLAKMYESQYPELKLMTGSLAGVNLDIQTARRAKDAGHKAGFPDIHLPVSRGQWFSLYIELKTDEGRASGEQLTIANMLREEGNLVLFIKGSEQAWNTIIKYLSMPKLVITKGEKPDAEKAQLPDDRRQVPLQTQGGTTPEGPGPGV